MAVERDFSEAMTDLGIIKNLKGTVFVGRLIKAITQQVPGEANVLPHGHHLQSLKDLPDDDVWFVEFVHTSLFTDLYKIVAVRSGTKLVGDAG